MSYFELFYGAFTGIPYIHAKTTTDNRILLHSNTVIPITFFLIPNGFNPNGLNPNGYNPNGFVCLTRGICPNMIKLSRQDQILSKHDQILPGYQGPGFKRFL